MSIKIKTSTPVETCGEVFFTPYIDHKGEIWLSCEGNGCGDDVLLDDLDGKSDSEIWQQYAAIDVTAMRADAAELREAGFACEADWIESWCDRLEVVQRGETVDDETRKNIIDEMRDNGKAEDADVIISDADASIREVWWHDSEHVYRVRAAGSEFWLLLGSGTPTTYEDVGDAVTQAMW